MDNQPRVRFGPDRRLSAAAAVLCLLAVYAAIRAPTPAGSLLLALAAAVLFGYAASDVMFWPRLCADHSGLVVRSPLARARLRWDEVDAVRADVRDRHGLRSVTLEIDAGERLIVLSHRALGADPHEAAQLVRAFDPRRR